MHATDKITATCKNCGSSHAWMVESHMQYIGLGVFVTCGACYDGAPDAGFSIGRGDEIEEALIDWQGQFD